MRPQRFASLRGTTALQTRSGRRDASHPQISGLDLRILKQCQPGTFVHHPADLENIAAIGDRQRRGRVLFDQQDRYAVALKFDDGTQHLLHQEGREPERRLVEQEQLRL
jgi:hypothetical protein